MSENKFPAAWDEQKVKRVLARYEGQSEEDAAVEDEAGVRPSDTVMKVPHELVAKVHWEAASVKRSCIGKGARLPLRVYDALGWLQVPYGESGLVTMSRG